MFRYRGVFDRQDSLRSDYLSDRETRYGIVQQASIDSTDSRLCYLTSSEVGLLFIYCFYYVELNDDDDVNRLQLVELSSLMWIRKLCHYIEQALKAYSKKHSHICQECFPSKFLTVEAFHCYIRVHVNRIHCTITVCTLYTVQNVHKTKLGEAHTCTFTEKSREHCDAYWQKRFVSYKGIHVRLFLRLSFFIYFSLSFMCML